MKLLRYQTCPAYFTQTYIWQKYDVSKTTDIPTEQILHGYNIKYLSMLVTVIKYKHSNICTLYVRLSLRNVQTVVLNQVSHTYVT